MAKKDEKKVSGKGKGNAADSKKVTDGAARVATNGNGGVKKWQKQLAPLRKLVTVTLELDETMTVSGLKVNQQTAAGLKAEIVKIKKHLEGQNVTIPSRLAKRIVTATAK